MIKNGILNQFLKHIFPSALKSLSQPPFCVLKRALGKQIAENTPRTGTPLPLPLANPLPLSPQYSALLLVVFFGRAM